jgi:hypothetical protein
MKISSISSVGGAYKTAESRPQRGKAAAPASVAKTNATSTASVAKTNASNAAQEAKETVAQTEKEAASGDQQAVRLLAREKSAAAKSAPAATGSRRLNIVA